MSYVVCRIDVNGHSSTLTRRSAPKSCRVELMVGGQIGDYPAGRICNTEAAIRAAESFCKNQVDETQTWVDD
jgi:hypothetical protein